MSDSDHTLRRTILETVSIADEYCKFLNKVSKHRMDDFFRTLRGLVPLLYVRGMLLPDIQPEHPEANERFMTEEEWDQMFTSLRVYLADQDEFTYLSKNEYGQDAILTGSIAEHLTDVYQDLSDFVLLFKKPSLSARENAIHECKSLFESHWGNRLAQLLPVLHHLQIPDEQVGLLNDFLDFL
ncbi:MAG: DUF5063 domain-containing protein [Bacteroidales bacterium]|nr:DUF5063 domain-containing protein [Bacteroidales bacterium]